MMFARKSSHQNADIAKRMRRFFSTLTQQQRSTPQLVASAYCRFLWDRRHVCLADEAKFHRSRFNISLATTDADFETLTKRAALVSDTLLLSHAWQGAYHEIDLSSTTRSTLVADYLPDFGLGMERQVRMGEIRMSGAPNTTDYTSAHFGVRCPSLAALGRWLLASERLLCAGLVWYLPSYSTHHSTIVGNVAEPGPITDQVGVVDYLVLDRRAVDTSTVSPIKSHLVRPILEIDLPFIDGVDLSDFSRITVDEFDSYRAFRDFLRKSFLDIDTALDAVQAEREIVKIGLEIADQVRFNKAEMDKVKTKRAVAASGAVVGTIGAALVAVYGPALQAALGVLGATGGLWGVMQAMAENSVRRVRDGKPWYYVWVLSRTADRNNSM